MAGADPGRVSQAPRAAPGELSPIEIPDRLHMLASADPPEIDPRRRQAHVAQLALDVR